MQRANEEHATANARSPIVERRVDSTTRSADDAERKRRRAVLPTDTVRSVIFLGCAVQTAMHEYIMVRVRLGLGLRPSTLAYSLFYFVNFFFLSLYLIIRYDVTVSIPPYHIINMISVAVIPCALLPIHFLFLRIIHLGPEKNLAMNFCR